MALPGDGQLLRGSIRNGETWDPEMAGRGGASFGMDGFDMF